MYTDIVNAFLQTILAQLEANTQLMKDIFTVTPQLTANQLPTGVVDKRIYSADIDMQQELANIYPRIMVDNINVSPIELQQSQELLYDIGFILQIYVPAQVQEYLGILEGDVRTAIVGQAVNGNHFIGGFCYEEGGYKRERVPNSSPMLWHSEIHLGLSATGTI